MSLLFVASSRDKSYRQLIHSTPTDINIHRDKVLAPAESSLFASALSQSSWNSSGHFNLPTNQRFFCPLFKCGRKRNVDLGEAVKHVFPWLKLKEQKHPVLIQTKCLANRFLISSSAPKMVSIYNQQIELKSLFQRITQCSPHEFCLWNQSFQGQFVKLCSMQDNTSSLLLFKVTHCFEKRMFT